MNELQKALRVRIGKFLKDNSLDAFTSDQLSEIFAIQESDVILALDKMVFLGQVWEFTNPCSVRSFQFKSPSAKLIDDIKLLSTEALASVWS